MANSKLFPGTTGTSVEKPGVSRCNWSSLWLSPSILSLNRRLEVSRFHTRQRSSYCVPGLQSGKWKDSRLVSTMRSGTPPPRTLCSRFVCGETVAFLVPGGGAAALTFMDGEKSSLPPVAKDAMDCCVAPSNAALPFVPLSVPVLLPAPFVLAAAAALALTVSPRSVAPQTKSGSRPAPPASWVFSRSGCRDWSGRSSGITCPAVSSPRGARYP
mmetsp:Transcript_33483/g.103394  ORF Transcript_33483/g.103394 Transcript_33483/m.103394 type:complete len:214 (-) Transcript_33483:677-1318(-)